MTDEALVGLAYEGAIEDDPWSSFLHEVRISLRSKTSMLMFELPGEAGGQRDLDDADWQVSALTRLYYSKYAPLNPIRYGEMEEGRIYSIYDFVERGDLLKSKYYTEFLCKIGLRYALIVRLPEADGVKAWLNISRGDEAGDYGADERRLIASFVPHLHRALRIYARLKRAEMGMSAYKRPLEKIKVATILLDPSGRVVEMSEQAQQLLSRVEGLSILDHRITFSEAEDSRAFERLIDKVMRETSEADYGVVTLGTRSGRPLNLLLRRFGDQQRVAGPFGGVLYLKDPREHVRARADAVSVLYGLKPTEARLAVAIAAGSSIRDAALTLGMTEHTVRTYVKRILEKTGSRRQADLVKLISSSLALMV